VVVHQVKAKEVDLEGTVRGGETETLAIIHRSSLSRMSGIGVLGHDQS
jgi:hypothetical protein